MKLVPYGKRKDQENSYLFSSNILNDMPSDNHIDEKESEEIINDSSPGREKIEKIQEAIEDVIGEPSFDGLMLILSAIGMTNIKINIDNDGTTLSVSGVINFSEPEEKISKKE